LAARVKLRNSTTDTNVRSRSVGIFFMRVSCRLEVQTPPPANGTFPLFQPMRDRKNGV
jgi:hypothetical protein